MARSSIPSPDEALAGMAKVGKPRKPMGKDALKDVSFPSATPKGKSVKLMPKKNTAAGDPTVQAKPARPNTTVERKGAAYGIRTNYSAPVSPEAGATQANGRIIRSAIARDNANFNDGNATSY